MHAHGRRSIQGISTRVPKGAHRATGGAMHGVMGQCMFMHAMTRMHGGVWLVWWIWHKITEPILWQHNYPKSLLVRSVLVQLVLNGRKNRVQLSQARRQFRAGRSGRGGSSSSLSVVGVRRRRWGRQRACSKKIELFIRFNTKIFCLFILAET